MDELKACPFCGGIKPHGSWFVQHAENCYLMARVSAPSYSEIDAWQTRPIEDALRAELARVTAERDALAEANRWIPVGERLPDDYDSVIFLDDNDDVHIGFHSKIPQWSSDDGDYWHGDTYSWITHWRPLPAPPEEVE